MAAGRRGRAEVPCWGADASIMAATAASPALKRLDLRDPAALFETHGAEEIRGLERQVRAEIEHKKEELRQMVGERYRDLIEAADTIGQMRRCAAGLVDAVRATDQYCARLRRAGSAAPRPPRDPQVSPAPAPRPGGPGPAGRRAPRPGPTRLRRRPRRPLPPRPACGTPAALPALLAVSRRLLGSLPGSRPRLPHLSPGVAGLPFSWKRWVCSPVPGFPTSFREQSSPLCRPPPLPARSFLPPPTPTPLPGTTSRLQRGLRPFAAGRWRVATSPRALIF